MLSSSNAAAARESLFGSRLAVARQAAEDLRVIASRAQLERRLAAHRRAAATHRRASLLHGRAATQAFRVGDEARALRELGLARKQDEGVSIEESRAAEVAAALAAQADLATD